MAVIGIFCSSKAGLSARYEEASRQLGEWMAQNGHTLLYGGSRCGLMHTVSHAAKAAGGRIYGAVPDVLVSRGLVSDELDVEFRCAGLSDRKEIFLREADVFVALPGGIGTLDEVFTVAAGATIGEHSKRVFLYNVAGCWDTLWEALLRMQREGLIAPEASTHIQLITSPDEITF